MSLTSSNNLSLNEVTDYSSDQFNKAIELYIDLFPPVERKSIDDIKDLLNKGIYKLFILNHNINDKIIGFALVMLNKEPEFLFIDNIAIDRNYQGSGYGTELIRLLIQMQNHSSVGVFVEVERPELALDNVDRLVREKRLDFYHKLKFYQLQGIDYQFPVPGENSIPLVLMLRPADNIKTLAACTIEQMIKAVYYKIHSENDNLDEIYQTFAHTITDQVFPG